MRCGMFLWEMFSIGNVNDVLLKIVIILYCMLLFLFLGMLGMVKIYWVWRILIGGIMKLLEYVVLKL